MVREGQPFDVNHQLFTDRKTGKTVIIVTHDVELIKNACTSVIRFDPSGSKIA
jgi:ABC-type polysaccharide/polyol phosphate transport system ATPase subunit